MGFTQAGNAGLAAFYLHELEEAMEELVEAAVVDDGVDGSAQMRLFGLPPWNGWSASCAMRGWRPCTVRTRTWWSRATDATTPADTRSSASRCRWPWISRTTIPRSARPRPDRRSPSMHRSRGIDQLCGLQNGPATKISILPDNHSQALSPCIVRSFAFCYPHWLFPSTHRKISMPRPEKPPRLPQRPVTAAIRWTEGGSVLV